MGVRHYRALIAYPRSGTVVYAKEKNDEKTTYVAATLRKMKNLTSKVPRFPLIYSRIPT